MPYQGSRAGADAVKRALRNVNRVYRQLDTRLEALQRQLLRLRSRKTAPSAREIEQATAALWTSFVAQVTATERALQDLYQVAVL